MRKEKILSSPEADAVDEAEKNRLAECEAVQDELSALINEYTAKAPVFADVCQRLDVVFARLRALKANPRCYGRSGKIYPIMRLSHSLEEAQRFTAKESFYFDPL